jgi:hypothetical protein
MNILILAGFAALLNPDTSSVADTSIHVPDKYLEQVKRKSDHTSEQVDKRTVKALDRFRRQEEKMQAKMMKKDSVAAKNVFGPSIAKLNDMKARLGKKTGGGSSVGDPYVDTLKNTLQFLKGADGIQASEGKLAGAAQSVDNLQGSLQQADMVKNILREQRQMLKAQLASYTGFGNDLTKMNKEAYYYGQQLNEYKAVLSDKKKAEEKAITLLKQSSQYNDFIKQHSQFASLFNLIGSSSGSADVAGLQTRSQVEQVISQRVGNDPAARSAVSQQLAQAKSQMNELKDKYANVDNAADMPDFKPNPMKSKSFLQRLEFGGNVQFQKSGSYFPTTSDIAGQVGYKFHKNGTIGIGIGYKLGMGNGWNHIAFSHQGIGLRSFMDWKLKGTFYVNGGFEENYMSAISHVSELSNLSSWQGSALLGISKKYKLNGKLKGNIMLLYDFLAGGNKPPTSAVKLRFGYTM